MHARSATGTRKAAASEGAAEGIVGAQAWRVQVVVAYVEGRAAGHDDAAWRAVHLVLVLEAGRREVGDGVGPGARHVRERVYGWRRDIGVRVGSAEGPVGVLGFLGAALGAGGGFGFGGLDVAFALELGNELLDNVDLEVVEDI